MDKNPVTKVIKQGLKSLVSPTNPKATGRDTVTKADQQKIIDNNKK